jgi:hypothetical protein
MHFSKSVDKVVLEQIAELFDQNEGCLHLVRYYLSSLLLSARPRSHVSNLQSYSFFALRTIQHNNTAVDLHKFVWRI